MSRADEQFRLWADWYKRVAGLEGELDYLLQGREVLYSTAGVFMAGGDAYDFHALDFFLRWLGSHWAGSTAVRLRAMTEKDDQTDSFRALLAKVRAHPHVFTRARYLEMVRADTDAYLFERGNKEWEDRYGSGAEIDPEILDADIAAIDAAAAPVAEFATKRIAHLDKKWSEIKSTYGPVYNCLEVLKELSAKYAPLFTGEMMAGRFGFSRWDARAALIPGEWKKAKQ
ncbi:MAG: hypothetical protein M3167_02440 [Acidobacteriota bacterium]|nr:hypothetical protein [Acidobacteriota bacterium]